MTLASCTMYVYIMFWVKYSRGIDVWYSVCCHTPPPTPDCLLKISVNKLSQNTTAQLRLTPGQGVGEVRDNYYSELVYPHVLPTPPLP
jgi:hypothetical protein